MKLSLVSIVPCLTLAACPPTPAAQTVETAVIKIADDTCLALDQQPEPEWVTVACTVEGVAAGVIAADALDGGAKDAAPAKAARISVSVLVKLPKSVWSRIHVAKDGGR
jgi:hypothetical protein